MRPRSRSRPRHRYRSSLVGLLTLAVCLSGGVAVAQQHAFVTGAATATGTVLTADVESYERVSTRPSLFGDTEYEANVSYVYAVDGTRYESDDIFPGAYTSSGSGRRTAEVATRFDAGESVTVYYDPANPDRSFLVPRYSFVPGFALLAAGVLLCAEFLTPGTHLFEWLFDRFTGATGGHGGGGSGTAGGTPGSDPWDDPPGVDVGGEGTGGETTGDEANAGDASDGRNAGGGDDASSGEDDADGGAPLAGRAALAVWVLAAACALGVVAAYVAVSARPYSFLAYVACVVGVGVPAVRVGALRLVG